MEGLRRKSLVALAWLTAFTTLASGAPQLTCVCPDGRVMAFCLSALPGLSRCCCGNACCRTAGGDCLSSSPVRPCCQARAAREAANKSGRGSHVEAPCCRKTLTPSKVLAVLDSSVARALTTDLHPAAPVPVAPVGPSSRTEERPPRSPPDDLTITLRRLVI